MPSKAQSYEGEAIHLAPETTRMLIHARSASFEKDKDNIDFNQPFLNSEYAFVFNGLSPPYSTTRTSTSIHCLALQINVDTFLR